jgi:hypothetical protein
MTQNVLTNDEEVTGSIIFVTFERYVTNFRGTFVPVPISGKWKEEEEIFFLHDDRPGPSKRKFSCCMMILRGPARGNFLAA